MAGGAEVARTIHKGFPDDLRPTPWTGLTAPPVYREGPLEIPRLPVDIYVEIVKRGAASLERLTHHGSGGFEQQPSLTLLQGRTEPARMDPCSPERFVRIDIADSTDHRLIEQQPLDLGVTRTQLFNHHGQLEF